MSPRKPVVRLATDGGQPVGRVTRTKRQAAQPATDAARLSRAVTEAYAIGMSSLDAVNTAELAANAAITAIRNDDSMTARALAREAAVSAGQASMRLAELLNKLRDTGGTT